MASNPVTPRDGLTRYREASTDLRIKRTSTAVGTKLVSKNPVMGRRIHTEHRRKPNQLMDSSGVFGFRPNSTVLSEDLLTTRMTRPLSKIGHSRQKR